MKPNSMLSAVGSYNVLAFGSLSESGLDGTESDSCGRYCQLGIEESVSGSMRTVHSHTIFRSPFLSYRFGQSHHACFGQCIAGLSSVAIDS